MSTKQTGFTLIEIAIVLVIIGLLLGGVLKGQELITGARVRNLVQQQDGIKAAYFGFLDRYRSLPGDYATAGPNGNIAGATQSGNGDGQIDLANAANPAIAEHILAWEHLAKSGFINGSYVYANAQTDASNPRNPYSGFMQLVFDNVYGAAAGSARHNLKTGPNIPVEIAAELDRKVDDGAPFTGSFQFSTYAGAGGNAPTGVPAAAGVGCLVAGPPVAWNVGGGVSNCGGASLY